MMNKINVQLYGGKSLFKGRETPLEAETIFCDVADKCSFYAEGRCLNCRSIFSSRCIKGRVEKAKGYTTRATKYWDFRNKYEGDELYNKLKYPSNRVGIIDDTLWMNLTYVGVRKVTPADYETEDKCPLIVDDYVISYRYNTHSTAIIDLDDLTVDLLYEILSREPLSIMGEVITTYVKNIVPDVLNELRKLLPDIYNEFISKYPQWDMEPNYVGKYAYIKTMTNGSILKDYHGNIFTLVDGKLYSNSMRRSVPFGGTSANIVIELSGKETYKVTDNTQCDDNTKFL